MTHHRIRPRHWLLGLFLGLVAVISLVLWGNRDASPVGHWTSEEGKEVYARSYAAAMEELPTPSVVRDVPTSYGTVRVYEFVNQDQRDRTPVVLLPGRASGVPMWAENLPALLAERRVFAFDALGDASMSVQTKPLEDAADQAAWIDEVLSELHLEQAHLVGHSFGGWLAANYALKYPQRVATLSLLEPVFVFQGLTWQMWIEISAFMILRMVPVLGDRLGNALNQEIGGADDLDLDDPMTRMITAGMKHYSTNLPPPTQFSGEQLRALTVPVYLALGSASAMHDATKALEVAEQTVPDLEAKIWPEGTHSLPMEVEGPLGRQVLSFMAAHESH